MSMQIFDSLEDPRLLDVLQAGAVGVLPTDTVYGIVAMAHNPRAVEKLYRLKHREHKPGTLIAADVDQLLHLGLPERYLKTVASYWPASLSIIIPAEEDLLYIHQGLKSIAVRVPADPTIRALLERTGPLLTSSANQPGLAPASTITEAQGYFGDEVDFYVDGGDISDHLPSTIIRINTDHTIEIIRQGAVHVSVDKK